MCYFRPDLFFPLKLKKSILCRTVNSGKAKKLSSMPYCSYVRLCQWRWKFKLNFIWYSKPDFWEINEKLMWFVDTVLKFVKIFHDDGHNSHWNLYVKLVKIYITFFSISSLWDSQNKFEVLLKISLSFSKISITFQRLFSQVLYNLFSNSSSLGVIFFCSLIDTENIST